jgi:hypothetical protein
LSSSSKATRTARSSRAWSTTRPTPSPTALPDNKTQLGLKTNSSKGGSGFSELRFEDEKDAEEIYMHAQKDFNWEVLNNETAKIKKDTTTRRGGQPLGHRREGQRHPQGRYRQSRSHHQGQRDRHRHLEEPQARHLRRQERDRRRSRSSSKVGSNSIKIDTSGITINGIEIAANANATIDIKATAPLTLQGAMVNIN